MMARKEECSILSFYIHTILHYCTFYIHTIAQNSFARKNVNGDWKFINIQSWIQSIPSRIYNIKTCRYPRYQNLTSQTWTSTPCVGKYLGGDLKFINIQS